jgi:hypothetical protein
MLPIFVEETSTCKALQEEEYQVIEVDQNLYAVVALITLTITTGHLSWVLIERRYRWCIEAGDTG